MLKQYVSPRNGTFLRTGPGNQTCPLKMSPNWPSSVRFFPCSYLNPSPLSILLFKQHFQVLHCRRFHHKAAEWISRKPAPRNSASAFNTTAFSQKIFVWSLLDFKTIQNTSGPSLLCSAETTVPLTKIRESTQYLVINGTVCTYVINPYFHYAQNKQGSAIPKGGFSTLPLRKRTLWTSNFALGKYAIITISEICFKWN